MILGIFLCVCGRKLAVVRSRVVTVEMMGGSLGIRDLERTVG